MQEKIQYSDIMALGFSEEISSDSCYFNQFGYEYAIISLFLTKKVEVIWAKETQLAEVLRIDGQKEMNIIKKMPIKNLEHLKELVEFFSDEKKEVYSYTGCC